MGTWITINSVIVAELLAMRDFDWLCIDLEHSVTDYNEMLSMIAVIQGRGKEAFVRVGDNDSLIIKRALDAGADGIIVPMVKSKEEAQKAVDAIYYPPIGTRGVGLARAQEYGFGFEGYRDSKSKNIKLIVQIEHIDAINDIEAIIDTEGVDGTFIGPYDLSGSMGKPGQWNEPDVIEALSRFEKVVKTKDKLIGTHVIEPDQTVLNKKIEEGYNFIAFSLDTLFLGSKVDEELNI